MKGIKWLALALAVAAAFTMLLGCSADPSEVIGTVGETPIYRWNYEQALAKQVALHEQYYGVDVTKQAYAKEYAELKKMVIDDLVGGTALKEEARKRGLYELSAAQLLEIDQEYNRFYEDTMATYIAQFGSDEKGMREAEKAFENLLKENYFDAERLRETIKDNYVSGLLMNEMEQNIVVSDAEVKAEYDRILAEQQEKCKEDPAWFGENPQPVQVYVPEGYVKVLRLAKKFNSQQMNELQAAANTLGNAAGAYNNALLEDGEQSASAKAKAKDMQRATNAYAATENSARAALDKVFEQEILAELSAGADFMELMNKKSEDVNLVPYYISKDSTHVTETFRDAALALANPGDISGKVNIEEGVCVIYLEQKLTPGIRPLEEVKEELRTFLTGNQTISQNFQLRSEYAQSAKDAGAVTLYEDKLK